MTTGIDGRPWGNDVAADTVDPEWLQEAENLLREAFSTLRARSKTHGDPTDTLPRDGGFQTLFTGFEVKPEEVAMRHVCTKLSREAYTPSWENKLDMIGYLILAQVFVNLRQRARESRP